MFLGFLGVGARKPACFPGFLRVREAAGGRHQGQMALKCRLAGRWGGAYGRGGEIQILLLTAESHRLLGPSLGWFVWNPWECKNLCKNQRKITMWGGPGRGFGGVLGPLWGVLGPPGCVWEPLGGVLEALPRVLSRLGDVRARLGGLLGAVQGRLGSFWGRLGLSRGVLGPSWGRLGAVLGPSWGRLGRCWGVLEPSWSCPGAS